MVRKGSSVRVRCWALKKRPAREHNSAYVAEGYKRVVALVGYSEGTPLEPSGAPNCPSAHGLGARSPDALGTAIRTGAPESLCESVSDDLMAGRLVIALRPTITAPWCNCVLRSGAQRRKRQESLCRAACMAAVGHPGSTAGRWVGHAARARRASRVLASGDGDERRSSPRPATASGHQIAQGLGEAHMGVRLVARPRTPDRVSTLPRGPRAVRPPVSSDKAVTNPGAPKPFPAWCRAYVHQALQAP